MVQTEVMEKECRGNFTAVAPQRGEDRTSCGPACYGYFKEHLAWINRGETPDLPGLRSRPSLEVCTQHRVMRKQCVMPAG